MKVNLRKRRIFCSKKDEKVRRSRKKCWMKLENPRKKKKFQQQQLRISKRQEEV